MKCVLLEEKKMGMERPEYPKGTGSVPPRRRNHFMDTNFIHLGHPLTLAKVD